MAPIVVVLGVLVALGVTLGVYSNGKKTAPITLPPLTIENDGKGARSPAIDLVALIRFTQHHQLPEMPDLNRLSAEAARDIFDALKAFADQPNSDESFGRLGRVLQSHEYSAMALECYTKAKGLNRSSYEWSYYIGRIHADAYEGEAAIAAYNEAAELNGEYAPTFLALGKLYVQSGETEKAQQAYQRLVSLRPKSIHGHLGLAQIAFDRKEFAEVVERLNELASGSRDFRMHNLLGQAYQQLGELEKARDHLAIVKSLDNQDQLTKHVFFDDPLYHKMLASNTTDTALSERLRAALAANQNEVAIRIAKQLSQRDPNDADRWHSLAIAYKKAKRYKEALASAEKSLGLNSASIETQSTKAQLLMILRRNKEAFALLDKLAKQAPDSFDVHYNRGVVCVLSNQYAAAVMSFRRAVSLNDRSARAHVALAEALAQLGERAESIAEYRRALELDPTNARAKQRLGSNR